MRGHQAGLNCHHFVSRFNHQERDGFSNVKTIWNSVNMFHLIQQALIPV